MDVQSGGLEAVEFEDARGWCEAARHGGDRMDRWIDE
jgi:hypothetical protein